MGACIRTHLWITRISPPWEPCLATRWLPLVTTLPECISGTKPQHCDSYISNSRIFIYYILLLLLPNDVQQAIRMITFHSFILFTPPFHHHRVKQDNTYFGSLRNSTPSRRRPFFCPSSPAIWSFFKPKSNQPSVRSTLTILYFTACIMKNSLPTISQHFFF